MMAPVVKIARPSDLTAGLSSGLTAGPSAELTASLSSDLSVSCLPANDGPMAEGRAQAAAEKNLPPVSHRSDNDGCQDGISGDFLIRPAQVGDAPAIFDLVRQGMLAYAKAAAIPTNRAGLPLLPALQESVEDTKAVIQDHNQVILVGCRGVQLAGSVRLDFSDPEQVLFERFAVGAAFRGQGLARLLFERAQQLARQKGGKQLILHTAYGDFAAFQLYLKWGFVLLDIDRKGPYPRAKMGFTV